MDNIVRQRSFRRAVILIAMCGITVPSWMAPQQAPVSAAAESKVPPTSAYAGAAACAQCHEKEARTYASTAHAIDSSLPSTKTILGDFSPLHAVLRTSNPNLVYAMVARPDGFYQSAVNISDPQHLTAQSERFDIVVGSGRHGQTYLYWKDDKLFELPVSYWTYTHQWVNSPGYPDGELHWDRAVQPRCLECHVSYFTSVPPPANRYVKGSLVLGIDCERCHGPGALHVARERSATPPRPGSPEEAIVNPAHLNRDQQMGLCSLCHAGPGPERGPALSYVVGDNIEDFLKLTPPAPNTPIDVHGNQAGALEESKCFTSGKLTCSTCHNVHETQENADAFSRHCMECHELRACGQYRTMGLAIGGKCIECHMPVGKSGVIESSAAGHRMQATMRAHRIAIYPDAGREPDGTIHAGKSE